MRNVQAHSATRRHDHVADADPRTNSLTNAAPRTRARTRGRAPAEPATNAAASVALQRNRRRKRSPSPETVLSDDSTGNDTRSGDTDEYAPPPALARARGGTRRRSLSRSSSRSRSLSIIPTTTMPPLTLPAPEDAAVRTLGLAQSARPGSDTLSLEYEQLVRMREGHFYRPTPGRRVDMDRDWNKLTLSEAAWTRLEEVGALQKGRAWTAREGIDEDGGSVKPELPYVLLTKLVIASSSRKMLTLNQIYQAMEERWPFFSQLGQTFRNSIRHNLSMNPAFINVERPVSEGGLGTGKGGYWRVSEDKLTSHRGRTKKPRHDGPAMPTSNATFAPIRHSASVPSSTLRRSHQQQERQDLRPVISSRPVPRRLVTTTSPVRKVRGSATVPARVDTYRDHLTPSELTGPSDRGRCSDDDEHSRYSLSPYSLGERPLPAYPRESSSESLPDPTLATPALTPPDNLGTNSIHGPVRLSQPEGYRAFSVQQSHYGSPPAHHSSPNRSPARHEPHSPFTATSPLLGLSHLATQVSYERGIAPLPSRSPGSPQHLPPSPHNNDSYTYPTPKAAGQHTPPRSSPSLTPTRPNLPSLLSTVGPRLPPKTQAMPPFTALIHAANSLSPISPIDDGASSPLTPISSPARPRWSPTRAH